MNSTADFTFDSIRQTLKNLPPTVRLKCHPDTWAKIKRLIPKREPPASFFAFDFGDAFDGLPMDINENYPRFVKRWEFPKDRFDENWAVPLGFGRWAETDEVWVAAVNDFYIRTYDYGMIFKPTNPIYLSSAS